MFKSLIFSLLFSIPVLAQNYSQVGNITYSPGQSSYKNYAKNPDCWKNVSGITVSAGTLSKNTSTPLNGDTSSQCNIVSTGSAQSYCWNVNTLGEDLKGQNCEAKFVYKGNASLYKAYVTLGTIQTTPDLQLINPTYSQAVSINFPCGDLTSVPSLCLATTGTGAASINVGKVYVGGATNLIPNIYLGTTPTVTKYLTGTGTFIVPANARYLRVKIVGAGGGGSGSGTSGGTGVTGGSSTFGTSLLIANGGVGGVWSSTSNNGGTATINSPAYGSIISGGQGSGYTGSTSAYTPASGGKGGDSPLMGGGAGGPGSAGIAGIANSGGGGGGGGAANAAGQTSGSGGGAGGFIDAIIPSPLSNSYSYIIGSGGSGGSAGASGFVGGTGGSGYIEITVY